VDACCLRGSSGALCVAAAGAWAVCLWTQTSAADWTPTHTWAFDKVSVTPLWGNRCIDFTFHCRRFDNKLGGIMFKD